MTKTPKRTKRRYAHEIYPHPGEWEIRPLSVEVPYLYAQAVGLAIFGTDWSTVWKGKGDKVWAVLSNQRIIRLIDARHAALLADAIHQGLTGDEAWEWAASRYDEEGGWVYDRAKHYGVPVEKIKPYPVLDEPDSHDHYGEPDAHGWRTVTIVEGRESDCPECCEPDEAEADTSDVDVCSGDADCTSALHVHGCFADSAGPCTDPDEHQPTGEPDGALRDAQAAGDALWLVSEIERLTAERDDMAWQRTQALNERDALAARVAQVKALADHWAKRAASDYEAGGTLTWGAADVHFSAVLREALVEPTGQEADLPLHRTEAGWPNCGTCDGGGCPDCTDNAEGF